MRIALFKNVELSFTCITKQMIYETDSACMTGYIRISEWVDVDIPLLDGVTVAQAEIAELDRLISAHQPSPMQERRDKLAAKLLDDGDLPMTLKRQAE